MVSFTSHTSCTHLLIQIPNSSNLVLYIRMAPLFNLNLLENNVTVLTYTFLYILTKAYYRIHESLNILDRLPPHDTCF